MRNLCQKDIAKKLGVSTATVSLVLNGLGEKYGISQKTRNKVLRTAEDSFYTKNFFASSLRRKSRKLITIVGNFDYKATWRQYRRDCLLMLLRQRGYDVIVEDLHHADEPGDVMKEAEKFRAAGLVFDGRISRHLDYYLDFLHRENVPVVLLDAPEHGFHDQVRVNRESVGYLAGKHLFEQGYKEVFYILPGFNTGGDLPWTVIDRCKGFEKARDEFLGKENAVRASDYIISGGLDGFSGSPLSRYTSPWSNYKLGYVLGGKFLDEKYSKDAGVLCINDQVALGLMKRLLDAGVRVPEEVGVVGTENLPESEFSFVPLSTVEFPAARQAMKVCEVLARRFEGDRGKKCFIELEPELKVRDSSSKRR